MKSTPKVKEILLDEEISEQVFISIFNSICKRNCYIYAIIPEWEQELFDLLSNEFTQINKFPLPRVFPREIGYLGYVKDIYRKRKYIYEFYLRATTLDFLVFSEFDVFRQLNNIDIYKVFESNRIPHITVGPDGEWLNVIEFENISSENN